MLFLVRHRETEFTRTIESFAPTTPTIVAEFDASLSGARLIWSVREDGAEVNRDVGAVEVSGWTPLSKISPNSLERLWL